MDHNSSVCGTGGPVPASSTVECSLLPTDSCAKRDLLPLRPWHTVAKMLRVHMPGPTQGRQHSRRVQTKNAIQVVA